MLRDLFKKQPSKLVAVVVPLSNRKELTLDENISLKHLHHFLGKYDKFFVMPQSLDFGIPGFGIKRFDDKKYFGSIKAHRDLLFSPKFYEAFRKYKYILMYHLDSLVFSDQLEEWCARDFDFIGPPWIKHEDAPYAGNPIYEGKVGNSGFALMKIESYLKVLYSKKYFVEPKEHWKKYYADKPTYEQLINFPKRIIKYLKVFNNVRCEISSYKNLSVEPFWVERATHYYPEFKVASVEEALPFAFECVPRYCFKKNNHTLPFGCHAWQKYDRAFWEPYLLK